MANAHPWHALLAVSIPLAEAMRGTRLDPIQYPANIGGFYAHLDRFLLPKDRDIMMKLNPGFALWVKESQMLVKFE